VFDTLFFLAVSAWNTTVPLSATVTPLPPSTGWLDTWNGNNEWTIFVYYANDNEPLRPVLYNANAWTNVASGRWLRYGNSASVEAQILSSSSNQFPYPGNVFSTTSTTRWTLPPDYNKTVNPPKGAAAQFRFNASMRPAHASDGHMVVIQPDRQHAVETYGTIMLSSGQVVAITYSVTDINKSLGDGWQNGKTASMLPAFAGIIDDSEIASGINHAIAVTAHPSCLKAVIAYPAYAFDRDATTSDAPPPYSGTLPMGARVALPPTLNINSLELTTTEGKAIGAAAQKYGFIINDRDGGTQKQCGFGIRVRPNPDSPRVVMHNYSQSLYDDLSKIFAKLAQVTFGQATQINSNGS
jgi:hypothetical protein